MNKSFVFFGRERVIAGLRALYARRNHVVIVGPAGIGKTALLRQVRQCCPILVCEETSSLRRICNSLERELGWGHHKLNVIERKNHLLAHLVHRDEAVAFDHVTHSSPRVARFITHLAEQIPIWIACRSDRPHQLGHLWPELYKFTRVELLPLTEIETRMLVEKAVEQENVQADAREHADKLHRMSGGNPRILEELLMELAARKYKIDSSLGFDLLDLDRRIHEIDLAVKATAAAPSSQ